MKKISLVLGTALLLGISANAQEPILDDILANANIQSMAAYKGGVRIDIDCSGFEDEQRDEMVFSRSIKAEGDYLYANEFVEYPDGSFAYFYYSSDPEVNLQFQTDKEQGVDKMPEGQIVSTFEGSILGYGSFVPEVESIEELDDSYKMVVAIKAEEEALARDILYVEKDSSFITRIERTMLISDSPEGNLEVTEITYSDDITVEPLFDDSDIDLSKLSFDTVDYEGNPVTTGILEGASLVMINFWEPWCGPCVQEMPDLEALYEKYKDQGFLIIGVYSGDNTPDSVAEVVEDTKVQYPIIEADTSLYPLTTQYVPTTVFADGEGKILTEEPYIGAHSQEEWEEIILSYMP